ncbi:MAG TPA: TolC family protein, partial [Saprospiraceae bacterium]|nr:TolC family protein [Saprospiraceae bacterium]
MNRFILTFIILSVTWYCGLQAYAQNSFSLEQAVQYAIKNSSETQKDLNRIADANAQMKALMASGLPQINGSAEYQYFVEVPEM